MPTAIQVRRFTREEFDRMAEAGVFDPGERLELLSGEICIMTPQRSTHAVAVGKTQRALEQCFGKNYWVRIQMPLVLDPNSEPEPDLAVVTGQPSDYRERHPDTALLVVEVADTSLLRDQHIKQKIYAQAGIAEYWIVNLTDQKLEVYREPHGEQFQNSQVLIAGQQIMPLAQSSLPINVSDLLP